MEHLNGNQLIFWQPRSLAELSIQKIRRTLERGCIDSWIKNENFIRFMLYLLQCDGKEILQIESSWIFTNIAAGTNEHTTLIVERGIVPLSVRLLASPSDEVIEQALWTLGNVIGDNVTYRDMMINLNIINHLLSMDLYEKSASFRRTYIWVIVNLVRCKDSQISLRNAQLLIPTINKLVMGADRKTRIDALWSLTYLADSNEDYIQLVIDSGIVSSIIPMLSVNRFKVQLAAMRMLGNIATGTDDQTNVLLENDLLIHIRFPLMDLNDNLRRMALWCLSNITLGPQNQVQAVFQSGLLLRISESLVRADMKTRREALYCMHNLITFGTNIQILEIINTGAVNSIFHLLLGIDENMAMTAQNALKTLFEKANQLVENYTEMYDRLMRSPLHH